MLRRIARKAGKIPTSTPNTAINANPRIQVVEFIGVIAIMPPDIAGMAKVYR